MINLWNSVTNTGATVCEIHLGSGTDDDAVDDDLADDDTTRSMSR
jgi:hypothetical protein